MERTDDLGIVGYKLIQDSDLFCFGTDAVYLSDFVNVKPGSFVVDLCSGNGIIPVLLCAKTKAEKIIGAEIQKESYDLAVRNAKINNLDDRLSFINCDVKDIFSHIKKASADVVTCNPPYMPKNMGFISPNDKKAAARHEIFITLDEIVKISASLLKFGGCLSMVHRADRLADVLYSMKKYKIEPKRLCFLHPCKNLAPNLILAEGMLGAKPSLKILPPVYIYDEKDD